MITEALELKGKRAVDLGCGYGLLTLKMRDAGAQVDAVDVASNAFKPLLSKSDLTNINILQDWVPRTRLADGTYDLVLSTDLIAELSPNQFRLYFSELARLTKTEGVAICSTPVDINAEDALERFQALAETEFLIKGWIFSYHRLYIRLNDFLAAPEQFTQTRKSREYWEKLLQKRTGLNRFWFKINSCLPLALLWQPIAFLLKPVNRWVKNSDRLLLRLEKFSRFLYAEGGISHALFVGIHKPLIVEPEPQPLQDQRRERVRKWE